MNTPTKKPPALASGTGAKVTEKDTPILLTEPEAARLLGFSARKVWGLRRAGVLPVVKVGGSIRYPSEGLAEWVRRGCPMHEHAGEEIRLELLRRAAGVAR